MLRSNEKTTLKALNKPKKKDGLKPVRYPIKGKIIKIIRMVLHLLFGLRRTATPASMSFYYYYY